MNKKNYNFPHIKATKRSLLMRKVGEDNGINDADHVVCIVKNGKKIYCPYYSAWKGMLKRVYSKKYQAKHHTYIGTTVCKEWHTFSIFKKWMEAQDWRGNNLDKDVLFPRNKHYSAETCVFISYSLNNLLSGQYSKNTEFPQGVSYVKSRNKYLAQISINYKTINLGRYNTIIEASKAYIKAKLIEINRHIDMQVDQRIIDGLYRHIKILTVKETV